MSSTANIACQQFNIVGAEEKIQAVPELSDVFSPPHHGPRSIPISVQLLENSEYSYVHFPIVNTGRYAIYLDTPGVFRGLIYGGTNQSTGTGTPIGTEPTSIGDCQSFAEGFVSSGEIIFNGDDPQPVAIQLSNKGKGGQTIKYIVSPFAG
jgi:hypothetical protein